jgi:hypothetical protein
MHVHVRRLALAAVAATIALTAPAAAHAGYADRVEATPGLEWYLPLDETEGRRFVDAVSGTRFGFATSRVAPGQPGALADPSNRAVRFLGGGGGGSSESHIVLDAEPTEQGRRSYSFEAWVQVERTDHRSLRIFSDEDAMGGMLVAARDGELVFSRYDSGLRFGPGGPDGAYGIHPAAPPQATSVAAPVTLDAWTHVVATFDGEQMRLFTDGIERASARSTFSVERDEMLFGAQAELGVRSSLDFDGRYWLEFRGSVDETALYRRALTPCEVTDHHRAAVAPSSTAVTTVCGTVED